MQRDHWSYVWLQCLLLSMLLCRNVVLPDSNKYYRTTSLCLHQNDQALYKKVDGAVVTSENELNLKCVLTFQTDTVLQRFMLRFEHLALDCKDHLYIFDGDQKFGKYEHDLSCRSTRSDVGTIFTQDTGCQTFRCLNDLCISKNLTCDGVNHCGDNSDETSQANCADESATKQILGLNFGTFVSLVLGIFLICCVCVVGVIICVFRKEAQQRQLETEAHLGTPHSMVVGQSPYPTDPPFSSSQLEEKPPPTPSCTRTASTEKASIIMQSEVCSSTQATSQEGVASLTSLWLQLPVLFYGTYLFVVHSSFYIKYEK
ncbi:hypothetical protein CEXT_713391 [Caerostris extrusa]|uniref:CUB domain-containing protein n=1 Tax=Caerostris extrusa TaxID=172846 RepID=A0AAV4TRI1_CAEEX|nr:hypothetical protein CEXT_713391 [Caerostris extrusa]